MSLAEDIPEPSNPLGIDGIEFIEYATAQPQAFGALLQKLGFAAVARHRSREVMLYRQGSDEPDRQLARARRDARAGALGDRAARARCRRSRTATRSTSAPGTCRPAPRRWSSTSPASTASATA